MELITVLDKDFEVMSIIDSFESFIWTTRYNSAGEFELYTPVSTDILEKMPVDNYLMIRNFFNKEANTARLMIIEGYEIETDHVKFTGRSLKSILERRIIWGQYIGAKDTDIQNLISTLINDNIINPSIGNRRISNFVFDTVNGEFGTLKEDTQYEGKSLYDIMDDLCREFDFGYEVYLDFSTKTFHMRLVVPVDHSFDKLENNPVIFSSKFENLKSSNYITSSATLRNAGLVSGERYSDDEIDKYHQTATFGDDLSGLDRREIFIDGSDIRHELDDGTIYGTSTYQKMLEERGESELKNHKYTKTFEGELDFASTQFIFGRDYNIGDIVEISNDFGISGKVRVTEMVISYSTSGYTAIPTFESVNDEDEENV